MSAHICIWFTPGWKTFRWSSLCNYICGFIQRVVELCPLKMEHFNLYKYSNIFMACLREDIRGGWRKMLISFATRILFWDMFFYRNFSKITCYCKLVFHGIQCVFSMKVCETVWIYFKDSLIDLFLWTMLYLYDVSRIWACPWCRLFWPSTSPVSEAE